MESDNISLEERQEKREADRKQKDEKISKVSAKKKRSLERRERKRLLKLRTLERRRKREEAKLKKKRHLPEDTVDRIQKKWRDDSDFELVKISTRTVILCGRCRSGKTTCMNVLKNPTYPPKEVESIFAETFGANFYSFAIKDKTKKCVLDYSVNVVDTPGFMEITPIGEEARDDESIKHVIKQCLERELTTINCVLIFTSTVGGIDDDDVEVIESYMDMVSGSGVRKALVVTRCDGKSDEAKYKLVNDLQQHSVFSQFLSEDDGDQFCDLENGLEAMNDILEDSRSDEQEYEIQKREKLEREAKKYKGGTDNNVDDDDDDEEEEGEEDDEDDENENFLHVLFTGAVNPSQFPDEESLNEEYRRVAGMREILLKFIFASWKRAELKKMKFVRSVAAECSDKVLGGLDFMKSLETETEFDGTPFLRGLDEHFDDMLFFKENKAIMALDTVSIELLRDYKKAFWMKHNSNEKFNGSSNGVMMKLTCPWSSDHFKMEDKMKETEAFEIEDMKKRLEDLKKKREEERKKN